MSQRTRISVRLEQLEKRLEIQDDLPNKRIKKPKRGKVNYLRDYPDGQDDSSLEDAQQVLVDEKKKEKP